MGHHRRLVALVEHSMRFDRRIVVRLLGLGNVLGPGDCLVPVLLLAVELVLH